MSESFAIHFSPRYRLRTRLEHFGSTMVPNAPRTFASAAALYIPPCPIVPNTPEASTYIAAFCVPPRPLPGL